MTALTADYEANRQDGEIIDYKIKNANTIYKDSLVCVAADGYLRPGADTAGFILAGVAVERSTLVAAESDGDRSTRVYKCGVFQFAAAGGGGASMAWVGEQMFIADDQTVSPRNIVTNNILAGICVGYISSTKVKVAICCPGANQWTEESWSSSSFSSSSSSTSA